jgi:hypothetical protein
MNVCVCVCVCVRGALNVSVSVRKDGIRNDRSTVSCTSIGLPPYTTHSHKTPLRGLGIRGGGMRRVGRRRARRHGVVVVWCEGCVRDSESFM